MSKTDLTKKAICEWSKKDLRENFDQLRQLVDSPHYVCLKCGRAANSKKSLCKPTSLN